MHKQVTKATHKLTQHLCAFGNNCCFCVGAAPREHPGALVSWYSGWVIPKWTRWLTASDKLSAGLISTTTTSLAGPARMINSTLIPLSYCQTHIYCSKMRAFVTARRCLKVWAPLCSVLEGPPLKNSCKWNLSQWRITMCLSNPVGPLWPFHLFRAVRWAPYCQNISNIWSLAHEHKMNHEASRSRHFTHVAALRCAAIHIAVISPLTSFTISEKTSASAFRRPPLSPSTPPCANNNRSNCNLLSAGTNIDLFGGPTPARMRAPLPPLPLLPLPSLNGDYVQQSSLLSNQRMPQKSHSLVMTLLFKEHAGFGWLYLL